MGILEITVLGVGLAMDAMAVSISDGMVYKKLKIKDVLFIAVTFGMMQGFMPLLGYYLGGVFEPVISRYGGGVIFTILICLGLHIIIGFKAL